ncbi:MAG TPA: hypothetical protein VHE30_26325 [Polyangiaceae bacterium]|nr:hypothetical protein [Polyangiaceae bacterium]
MTARATFLAAALAVLGCSELGRHTTVSPEEYAAYRRFRLAENVGGKLGAGYDYVSRWARGSYEKEVRSYLARTEPDTLGRVWNDAQGLEGFLRVVPHGKYADRAATRLVELELAAEYRARTEHSFDAKIEAMQSRLAAADAGRRRLVSQLVSWVKHVAAVRSWGKRTSELDSDMIFAYRLSEPAARCDDDRCVKTVVVSYAIPEGKVQSPREAVFDVGLELSNGGVVSAYVTGPDLFSRLGEAVTLSAVSPTDALARAEAIGQATQVLALAIEPNFPSSRCAVQAVSPVVLERHCDGVSFRAISALSLEEEDRIVVVPDPAPVSAAPATAPPSPAPAGPQAPTVTPAR